ncbi:hypothetical protein PMAYCL1PPCAC_04466 [Pristionchus mayeri]|uniref:C2H2-type domain-containing protein n=1 Tax=Pristionchus mayeri TaxID=1317129 RepID=A0AAN4Z895_9BILA|nr:hypothetical protein PMAYCL1PPCAC_04466 [Pristionchus mayeri]
MKLIFKILSSALRFAPSDHPYRAQEICCYFERASTNKSFSMDPAALFSYLTAQQMIGQQLGFPLLQTGAVPMTIQASTLQPAATSPLINMDQCFKPVASSTTASNELLLQILNNNGFGAASMASQLAVAPPQVKQQAPQTVTSMFEQLLTAQQANSMQHPLFVDHASAFAALSVQPPQIGSVTSVPIALSALMPPNTVDQSLITLQQPIVVRPQRQAASLSTPHTAIPVIRIESREARPMANILRGENFPIGSELPSAPSVKSPTTVLPQPTHLSPIKNEVCSPAKSSLARSGTSPAWLSTEDTAAASVVASTSKSNSVDEDMESMMSGEEEERYRPEDACAGRQRRADHIAFHRKMKALLKSLRGSDLICKMCSVKVDRHDNAFKTHIAEHVNKGANLLECRYCGYETPSRVEMNVHMGERHPNGSERAYTDKRDHLKMIEIMNQCFAKLPRPTKSIPKKDPALVKPRMTRKRRLAAEEAAAAAAAAATDGAVGNESFENVIVRYCSDTQGTEAECACGDTVPLNPSALLAHVKTLHAQYRCSDCGDVLDSPDAARDHTVKMHGGDPRTYSERIVDHLMVRSMQQRFVACFIRKQIRIEKSHAVRVLQNEMIEELEKNVKKEIKEELADIKKEPVDA